MPADRVVEPLLDQVGVAVVEPGDEGAEIATLRFGQGCRGMRGDQHDRDACLGHLRAQGRVGVRPGRHVEKHVEPDHPRAGSLELDQKLAQERAVDR